MGSFKNKKVRVLANSMRQNMCMSDGGNTLRGELKAQGFLIAG